MEKTAKEWFQHLKEPWRSEAIKASDKQVRISRIKPSYPSLSEALLGEFTWEDTPQEWLYWHKIHISLESGETMYLSSHQDCK